MRLSGMMVNERFLLLHLHQQVGAIGGEEDPAVPVDAQEGGYIPGLERFPIDRTLLYHAKATIFINTRGTA